MRRLILLGFLACAAASAAAVASSFDSAALSMLQPAPPMGDPGVAIQLPLPVLDMARLQPGAADLPVFSWEDFAGQDSRDLDISPAAPLGGLGAFIAIVFAIGIVIRVTVSPACANFFSDVYYPSSY